MIAMLLANIPLYIGLGIVVLALLTWVTTYNALVRYRNACDNAWSQVDVQLKRRYDLIPNLVETAKGYLKHESETLTNVVKAHQQAIDASNVKDQAAAENFLKSTLRSLFAVTENYPDLKANENMMALQEELTSTESRISFARQHYNDSVLRYNNKRQVFPSNIYAGFHGFQEKDYFELEDEAAREPVKVSF